MKITLTPRSAESQERFANQLSDAEKNDCLVEFANEEYIVSIADKNDSAKLSYINILLICVNPEEYLTNRNIANAIVSACDSLARKYSKVAFFLGAILVSDKNSKANQTKGTEYIMRAVDMQFDLPRKVHGQVFSMIAKVMLKEGADVNQQRKGSEYILHAAKQSFPVSSDVHGKALFTLGKMLREDELKNCTQKKAGVEHISQAAIMDHEPACVECCRITSEALKEDWWELSPNTPGANNPALNRFQLSAEECNAIVKALEYWEPKKLAATYYLGAVLYRATNPRKREKGEKYVIEAASEHFSPAYTLAGTILVENRFSFVRGCKFWKLALPDEEAERKLTSFRKTDGGAGFIEAAEKPMQEFLREGRKPRLPGQRYKT